MPLAWGSLTAQGAEQTVVPGGTGKPSRARPFAPGFTGAVDSPIRGLSAPSPTGESILPFADTTVLEMLEEYERAVYALPR